MRNALLFGGARVLTGLITAVGLGVDFSGISILGLPSNGLRVTIAVTFAVFVILTLWREIDIALQQRPKISVRAFVSDNKRLGLEVTNDGLGADFSAKATIRSDSTMGDSTTRDSFDIPWETNGQVRCHIDGGGGEANLLVAVLPKTHKFDATEPKSPTLIHTGELQLLTMKQGRPIGIRLYGIKYDVGKDEPPNYECELEVTITSEPTLRNPFKRKLYSIKLKGLELSFSEPSVPDKVGSQT